MPFDIEDEIELRQMKDAARAHIERAEPLFAKFEQHIARATPLLDRLEAVLPTLEHIAAKQTADRAFGQDDDAGKQADPFNPAISANVVEAASAKAVEPEGKPIAERPEAEEERREPEPPTAS